MHLCRAEVVLLGSPPPGRWPKTSIATCVNEARLHARGCSHAAQCIYLWGLVWIWSDFTEIERHAPNVGVVRMVRYFQQHFTR